MKTYCVLSGLMIAITSSSVIANDLTHQQWDGITTGKVSKIQSVVSGETHYQIRVMLEGQFPLCNSDKTWAYFNTSDADTQLPASILLAARSNKKSVTLYTTKDEGTGYCKIGLIDY